MLENTIASMSVSPRKWASDVGKNIRHMNKRGIARTLYNLYVGAALHVEKGGGIGTNVFEQNWDALIVLDACRADAIKIVADEYEFIDTVDSIYSVGSTSFEWMAQTFHNGFLQEISKTAHVSGNPYVNKVFYQREWPPLNRNIPIGPRDYDSVEASDFCYLDEVRRYGVDEKEGAVPSRTITDRAISVSRNHNFEKLIVHYMRPHEPYHEGDDPLGHHVLQRLQRGELEHNRVWQSYIDNLRGVLDELKILLKNIDAERVAITADHGEAFGEWGFYGHTIANPHPCVKRVPWIQTSASDEHTFEPKIQPRSRQEINPNINKHLEDLGYL